MKESDEENEGSTKLTSFVVQTQENTIKIGYETAKDFTP